MMVSVHITNIRQAIATKKQFRWIGVFPEICAHNGEVIIYTAEMDTKLLTVNL